MNPGAMAGLMSLFGGGGGSGGGSGGLLNSSILAKILPMLLGNNSLGRMLSQSGPGQMVMGGPLGMLLGGPQAGQQTMGVDGGGLGGSSGLMGNPLLGLLLGGLGGGTGR